MCNLLYFVPINRGIVSCIWELARAQNTDLLHLEDTFEFSTVKSKEPKTSDQHAYFYIRLSRVVSFNPYQKIIFVHFTWQN
jgi:hypothetical protein